MKSTKLLILLLFTFLISSGQVYKSNKNCYTTPLKYNFYTSVERLGDIKKERDLQLFTGCYEIETPHSKLAIGLGYFQDMELYGQYKVTNTYYGIINTTYIDSVYYEDGILHYSKIQIDEYDSITEKTTVANYSEYAYSALSIKYNLKIATWHHVTFSIVTEPKFIFEIKKIIPPSDFKSFTIINPERNNVFLMGNLGGNIYYKFRPHKELIMPTRYKTASRFSIFASYTYNIQIKAFQPAYSNKYNSFAVGLLFSL